MFWFKSCPKCHGDLYKDSDIYGTFIACLQCGRYLTQVEEAQQGLPQPNLHQQQPAQFERERVAA